MDLVDKDAQIAHLLGQVKVLEQELERVRDANVMLSDALRTRESIWPMDLGLTAQEEIIMRVLHRNVEIATKEMIYTAMYSDRPDCDWPELKIVDVVICKIRHKLPADVIATVWGRGYRLTPTGRQWLDDRIAKSKARTAALEASLRAVPQHGQEHASA